MPSVEKVQSVEARDEYAEAPARAPDERSLAKGAEHAPIQEVKEPVPNHDGRNRCDDSKNCVRGEAERRPSPRLHRLVQDSVIVIGASQRTGDGFSLTKRTLVV